METPPPSPHRLLAGLRPDRLMAEGLPDPVGKDTPPRIAGLEILNLIGRGGMGAVYLARQLSLDRVVAVKRVAPELARDAVFLDRLEREARTMAGLRHPHIVTVHHLEPLDDGGAAIVMEFVPGGNLRDRIAMNPGGMPVPEAVRLSREIASALGAAHDSGIVHRDLKPENILLDDGGSARVTDFGLALPMTGATRRLTLTGTTVGTVDYMAPEQFRNNQPDVRGDVYSLGVVLYEMLTGTVPRGSFDPPQRIRKRLPKHLGEAVMRALRPEPAARFQTMAGFAGALNPGGTRISRRGILFAMTGAAAAAIAIRQPWQTSGGGARHDPVPAREPGGWNDALRGVDPAEAAISGSWGTNGNAIVSNDEICILALASEMPESYDVRATFTRLSGKHSVAVFLKVNGAVGSVDIDGWEAGLAGFQGYADGDLRSGGGFQFPLANGRRHELLVEVRGGEVAIFIDGAEKSRIELGRNSPHIVFPWAWNPAARPAALAIGSYRSPTRFDRVAWREAGAEASR